MKHYSTRAEGNTNEQQAIEQAVERVAWCEAMHSATMRCRNFSEAFAILNHAGGTCTGKPFNQGVGPSSCEDTSEQRSNCLIRRSGVQRTV